MAEQYKTEDGRIWDSRSAAQEHANELASPAYKQEREKANENARRTTVTTATWQIREKLQTGKDLLAQGKKRQGIEYLKQATQGYSFCEEGKEAVELLEEMGIYTDRSQAIHTFSYKGSTKKGIIIVVIIIALIYASKFIFGW